MKRKEMAVEENEIIFSSKDIQKKKKLFKDHENLCINNQSVGAFEMTIGPKKAELM